MIDKKEDNIRSESFYPDSNYYLDQENTPKDTPLSKDQTFNTSKFEWPNTYWFIAVSYTHLTLPTILLV